MLTNTTTALTIAPDTISDILYFARTDDLPELMQTVSQVAVAHKATTSAILHLTIDSETGNTPLHYAAANGSMLVLDFLLGLTPPDDVEIVTRGNHAGNTPLHYAALNGKLDVCELLVEKVAKRGGGEDGGMAGMRGWKLVSRKNGAGCDAVAEAERGEKDDLVVWLLGKTDEFRKAAGLAEGEESADGKGGQQGEIEAKTVRGNDVLG